MSKQVFVADTILTASAMNTLQGNDYNQTVSTKTASYTLVAADVGTKVVMNSASATTITVNTSLFSAGDTLTILNIAAGVCTITAGTATVSTTGSLALAQNGGGTLYFTSAGVSVFQADGVTAGGLTLISTTTFAAASTATISNCFTATYRNYRLMIEGVSSADGAIQGQLRVSSVTTTTNYERQRLQATSTTVSAVYGSGLSAFLFVGSFTSRPNSGAVDMFSPAEAVVTSYQSFGFYNDTNPVLQLQAGKQTDATAFDSLVVSVSSGTFTGTVSLYGYSK